MPNHPTIRGKITHVFGHRFVVETERGAILADITPKGLDKLALHVGDNVELAGEMKPTELKVTVLKRDGKTTEIEHKKKHDDHHHHGDPREAIRAAEAAGFTPLGEPRRKPKHYEVLGKRGHHLLELHIELDGRIRKMKDVDRHDPKWAHAIA